MIRGGFGGYLIEFSVGVRFETKVILFLVCFVDLFSLNVCACG